MATDNAKININTLTSQTNSKKGLLVYLLYINSHEQFNKSTYTFCLTSFSSWKNQYETIFQFMQCSSWHYCETIYFLGNEIVQGFLWVWKIFSWILECADFMVSQLTKFIDFFCFLIFLVQLVNQIHKTFRKLEPYIYSHQSVSLSVHNVVMTSVTLYVSK